MEYFQKQIASFSPNNEKEVSITNQFGFVEHTLDINTASTSRDKDEDPLDTALKLVPHTVKASKKLIKTMKQENARVFKWKEMLENFPEKVHPKLKQRVRKGLPDCIRGYAWQILIQGDKVLGQEDKSQYFKQLMEREDNQKTIISIFKDISRTFP